ncbi:hypothetical protein [Methylobacterium sp. J-076]|uniref:hypothetical protein n=1 Tax=Methylobacterium sp. J-076 TaxID=2836655 RepID=UPI001FBAD027|nr:hypothetical protein [Methylobacterium sp. J-076]MCJ2011756.1 hypothetical protein [Methylobacterium sp. J-076]
MAHRHTNLVLVVLAAAPLATPAQSQAAPVNNWAEFHRAMAGCWTVPPGTDGSLIAYRFGLDKTGAIRGTPLTTARRLTGDRDAQARYEEAGSAALSRCFPMTVTASFGAILGESPIYLRFVNTPPTAAYQLNNNITVFAPR